MATPAAEFNSQQRIDMAQRLGVHLDTVTDTFGRVDVRLDRTAMRAFRDAALAHGFTDIASVFAKALNAGGTTR